MSTLNYTWKWFTGSQSLCYWVLLLLFSGCLNPVIAQRKAKEPQRAPRQVNFKRLETQHLQIYFTPEFQAHATDLATEGERFLGEIAGRWAVILPEDKIEVSIGRNVKGAKAYNHLEAPRWLKIGYDDKYARVEIRVDKPKKFNLKVAGAMYRHALVHALLNLPKIEKMPRFLEEGLARHYSGDSKSRTRVMAVIGFSRFESIAPFFEDKTWKHDEDETFIYAGAVAGLFVAHLWEGKPESEIKFVQSILQGKTWRAAVGSSGLGEWETRVAVFDVHERAEYKWYTVAYTFDFWLILLSITLLIWMVLRVRGAWNVARMSYVDVIIAPEEEVTEEELVGPAFGAEEPVLADVAPLEPEPPRPSPPNLSSPQAPPKRQPEAAYSQTVVPPKRSPITPPHSPASRPGSPLTPPHVPTGGRPVRKPNRHPPAAPPLQPPMMPPETVMQRPGRPTDAPIQPPPKPGAARQAPLQPGTLADAFGNLDNSIDEAFQTLAGEDADAFADVEEEIDNIFDDIETIPTENKRRS